MSKFSMYDVVYNPRTKEQGTILEIFEKGELVTYYVEIAGRQALEFWAELPLELIHESL